MKRWAWWLGLAALLILVGALLGPLRALVVGLLASAVPGARRVAEIEMKAARAAAEAERLEAEHGREEAIERIELRYRATLKALDERQTAQAVELRRDPRQLSRFLARRAGRL